MPVPRFRTWELFSQKTSGKSMGAPEKKQVRSIVGKGKGRVLKVWWGAGDSQKKKETQGRGGHSRELNDGTGRRKGKRENEKSMW